jgi:spermidine synthase
MLGGCAYSYPKDFLKRFPNAHMDVVEIDPVMTELAKKYFRLKEDARLTTYHEDARRFLNRSDKTYDVIYGDAFNSISSVPFQLTTKEAIQREYDLLNDGGVVLANLISSIDGTSGKFLRAEYATYRSIFPQVYLFPVAFPENGARVQNILLVAIKSDVSPLFESKDSELAEYLKHRWQKEVKNDLPILTDDYAPVDYYKRESL